MSTITATRAAATIPGEIRWYPCAVSQTFLKGQFVYLDVNGRVTACASDPVSSGVAGIAEVSYTDILKAAGKTSTDSTLGLAVPVTLAKRGQQFTMNITNAGTNNTATAISQVGKVYSLYVVSNICYLDVGDVTNRVFVVDGIAEDNTLGDTGGRVIVEVRGVYAQLDSGTS